jgi:DNA-binding GntR family transcriptional regulator
MPAAPSRSRRAQPAARATRAAAPHASAPAAPTLNEEAYRLLEELIVTLQLAPGSVVSEAGLSERIGIGTTPIREALQRLAREHLVQILPRRGVIVTGIDVRLQLQVLETRRELDRLIARSAARRATAAEREQMARTAAQMGQAVAADDLHGFLQLDAQMNLLAAQAARNEVAARAVAALHSVSRRFWFFHHERWPGTAATLQLHVQLAEALAAGSEARVAAASDALIDDLDAFARSTLAPV